MELKEIIKLQEEFTKEAFPEFWNFKNENDFLYALLYFSNALCGESGELANLVKKIVRDKIYRNLEINFEEYKEKIKEEIADVFIYIINLSVLLNIDLEKAFLRKFRYK